MPPHFAFLTRPPFHLLLFVLGCLLFGWPLLSIVAGHGPTATYWYFFAAWAALILALVLIGRALGRRDAEREEGDV
jgi:hypothetical protein